MAGLGWVVMRAIYELQPQIDKARERYYDHRKTCLAPLKPWGPEPPRRAFQVYDCAECDRLFDSLMDFYNRSRVTYVIPSQQLLQ